VSVSALLNLLSTLVPPRLVAIAEIFPNQVRSAGSRFPMRSRSAFLAFHAIRDRLADRVTGDPLSPAYYVILTVSSV